MTRIVSASNLWPFRWDRIGMCISIFLTSGPNGWSCCERSYPGSRASRLWDPASGVAQLETLQAAADQFQRKARTLKVSAVSELEEAFATATHDGVDAVLVLSSPLFGARPTVLAGLALRHKLPAVTLCPDFARAGGLIAYGPNLFNLDLIARRSSNGHR
jgi:hypothetical protein